MPTRFHATLLSNGSQCRCQLYADLLTACAGLAFVGNGKHLVSGGRDASVCFWSPSKDSGEKFIAERMARLQPAYEGTEAPAAGPPVNVRTQTSPLGCRIHTDSLLDRAG